GKELNELMGAVRLSRRAVIDQIKENGQNPSKPETSSIPALTATQVLAEFERLKQEQYSQHGMVPIYALRQVIAERFGIQAATHDSLDSLLKDLRRQQQIRLVALGNAGGATEQQLADSIPGEDEIYFAVEDAHEHIP